MKLDFKNYIDKFNRMDDENVIQSISNDKAYDWLLENIPRFECPDKDLEETYYFRWWTYRKHVKETIDGYVITEFHPDVSWAGKHNTIVCPAGHHFYEGRWLRNKKYLMDYAKFWFSKGDARSYSTWLIDAIWQFAKTKSDTSIVKDLFESFEDHYLAWSKSHGHESGLFWSIDDRDGGEHSISGNGLRPTLNSYMCADLKALSEIAGHLGLKDKEVYYYEKYNALKNKLQKNLWDENGQFYKVYPLESKDSPIDEINFEHVLSSKNVREIHGYIPFAFNLADDRHTDAWMQIKDEDGFMAPFGPTTAEQRHPLFMFPYEKHQCLWNGPSWPFLTSFTLMGMGNTIRYSNQSVIDKYDFYRQLKMYTNAHYRIKTNGTKVNWIDENLDPFSGEWLARKILISWGWPAHKGGKERGKDYNHSTYCDIIISQLLGVDFDIKGKITVQPLIPDEWDYFCLEGIDHKGDTYDIYYDKTGLRYKLGKGLNVRKNNRSISS